MIWEVLVCISSYVTGGIACSWSSATYDDSGFSDYTDIVDDATNDFAKATVLAGTRISILVPTGQ